MPYPIAMTTYNRPEYFLQTLKNLEDAGTDLSYLHIFDDCSDNKAMKNVLAESMNKYIIKINDHRLGAYLNIWQAVDELYNKYDSKYLFYIQDDIDVIKGWQEKAIDIFEHALSRAPMTALISLFHWQGDSRVDYYLQEHGHKGAVGLVFFRKFWEVFRTGFRPEENQMLLCVNDRNKVRENSHAADYKIYHCAHLLGWLTGYTGKSLVDHLGFKSSISCSRDMSPYRGIGFRK